ncbi:MAG: hypothetical protein A3B44_00320 [Candidatus Levybacteria bacterium RIFCSPLOWO2_01_FULL_38_21]|nr:MAG: hypothetical protein A3B44_00320 [Candidatus Levybacteria bacterium RIFCSPLOWO2_01_FULL_38_21]
MQDNGTPEAVEPQQRGTLDSTEPVTTQAEFSPPSGVAVTPESLPLGEKYSGLAARFRELGQKQLDGVLSEEERRERENLNQMASFGLFEANLSEKQLEAKDAAYKALIEAEAKELIDPQASAERYRLLGRKKIESVLTDAENKEYNRLEGYAKRGKFVLTQAA